MPISASTTRRTQAWGVFLICSKDSSQYEESGKRGRLSLAEKRSGTFVSSRATLFRDIGANTILWHIIQNNSRPPKTRED